MYKALKWIISCSLAYAYVIPTLLVTSTWWMFAFGVGLLAILVYLALSDSV